MKTLILSFILLLFVTNGFTQTATNFTIKDCTGNMHDLYSELDSGKVVVLNWVMPCGACVPASLTTFNVVQSYQETNPGTVRYYLVDDAGNTPCASLISWAKGSHITPLAAFSDTSINMLDYGTQSMPKVVVLGGASHNVFLVADAVVEVDALQSSINAALITAGIPENAKGNSQAEIYPNPATDQALLTIDTERAIPLKAELFSIQGINLGTIYDGTPSQGISQIRVDISQHLPGIYFVRLSSAGMTRVVKLIVKH